MRYWKHWTGALLLALLAVPTAAGPAWAEDKRLAERKVGITAGNGELRASFSYRDAFTKKVRKKLTSGLPTRVVLQINLEKPGKRKPLAYWARTIHIVYDLWEEHFVVTLEDDQGRHLSIALSVCLETLSSGTET